MNDSAQSEMRSHDEPLFVLKCDDGRVGLKVIVFAFAGLMFGANGYVHARNHEFGAEFLFITIFGSLVVIGCLWYVTQIILFKEVRLYNDRIVKISDYLSPIEVGLANAKFCAARSSFQHLISVVDRNYTGWRASTGFTYDEWLADKNEVRKFYSLLADLVGRKVEEFDGTVLTIDPLVKDWKRG